LKGLARSLLGVAAVLAAAPAGAGDTPRFSAEDIAKGRGQYQSFCVHCHGFNMVNAGTTVFDLRKFPLDQPERFRQSVTQGKGAMPSWKDTLTPEQIEWLWAYVGSRGGKEP
jgi:mono/diheme cytochrome c family protein